MRRGFTLIELTVVLTIISVMVGGSLVLLVTSTQQAAFNSTVATMDAIEKALLNYSAAFSRIPCPSSLTALSGSASYGIEAGTTAGGVGTGECVTGMTPAANYEAASSGAEEGGVPTRALRLPDSYMYDGWGHRLRYAVNPAYTVTTAAQCPTASRAITVNDSTGTARSTAAIYAIISHGANGHGAYTPSGIIVNAASTNTDELQNCNCTSTGAPNASYVPTYIQKAPIPNSASPHNSFDDIVAFKENWQLTNQGVVNNTGCSGWLRAITINGANVSTVNQTTLSSFPVLFTVAANAYSDMKTVANGGSVVNANGYDITFTSDAAGKNLLPFERESYAPTTGAMTFWIQLPSLSYNTNTVFYMNYGNPNITTDQSNKTGVWDGNYLGVWHLSDNAANTTVSDSTSNTNTGTSSANTSTKTTTGEVASALSFNGTSNKVTTLNDTISGQAQVTVSAWVKTTGGLGTQQDIYMEPTSGGSGTTRLGFVLYGGTSVCAGKTFCIFGRDGSREAGGGILFAQDSTIAVVNTWYDVVGVFDSVSKTNHLMVNGVDHTNTLGTQWPFSGAVPASKPYIGAQTDNSQWWGGGTGGNNPIDELRVSKTARSVDWNTTEYNNQSNPGVGGFLLSIQTPAVTR